MKSNFILFVGLSFLLISSCKNDQDAQGRLFLKSLTTSSGKFSLSPMTVSDSASRLTFIPDTFFYKNKPYSGAIAQYEYDTILSISGFMKNGLLDSAWIFYFTSGGVKMNGVMKEGIAVGVWKAYYGYDKVSVQKDFDQQGFLIARKEFYDNGQLKNEQNINAPGYLRERSVSYDKQGKVTSIYVKDSIKE
jgi:hypothetical protein